MTDDPMRTWLTRLSLGAGVAFTASAEYQLARTLGANQVIAAMLPVAVDAYVIAALRWFRAFDIALSLSLMGAAQISAHLLDARVMRVNIPMVVVVSLLVPVAIWRTHALARRTDTSVAAVPEAAPGDNFLSPAEGPDVIQTHPAPAVGPEPVPAPEVQSGTAYPELPAVPETPPVHGVNADIVHQADPAPGWTYITEVQPADQPRHRTQVHAEYVPEAGDDSPPPPAEDKLTARARLDFADLLADGRTPPIRTLRDTYSIGQVRAQRIQRELSTR